MLERAVSDFTELNPDQRREAINTQQRHAGLAEAQGRRDACRGSMVWGRSKGRDYLLRSAYDKQGRRRQTSLGLRSPETERIKAEFEQGRLEARARWDNMRAVMDRQAAINRALGLGRVPLLGARIIRSLDAHGLLGSAIRVLGTNALYAYEAAAGVRIESGLTATEDIDLLLDTRARLQFVATAEAEREGEGGSLLRVLQQVDASFERSREPFRARNRDGYIVDLIKPLRNPPWRNDRLRVSADAQDLEAVELEGLAWHESALAFEAIAIDERGEPLRIVASDPRVFAIHKHWLSQRLDREPIKKPRDLQQARVVAALVAGWLPHLPLESEDLRMLPKALVEAALPLFKKP
jgi:hypothetical protein